MESYPGFTEEMSEFRKAQGLEGFEVGRVILEHKERYVVVSEGQEYEAELLGALRFTAQDRTDFPAVGDWVAIQSYDDDKALIHKVFPRFSSIERQAVGSRGQVQIIAANVNSALIVQSVNRDFSVNRLERYVLLCNQAKVNPILVLSKIDLCSEEELKDLEAQIENRFPSTPLIKVSSEVENGFKEVEELIEPGKTYCLLGSSGVGKSTLLNALLGDEKMETKEISDTIDRGKHTTTHRELVTMENGGFLIDNPGMREVGVTGISENSSDAFELIEELSASCKYGDCSHTNEKGCAVLEALDSGALDEESFANFQRIQRETAHFESDYLDRRKKDKSFGKMIRSVQKMRKRDKF